MTQSNSNSNSNSQISTQLTNPQSTNSKTNPSPRKVKQSLTRRQQLILQHIFTYRFLTIYHLLVYFNQKHRYRIQLELNDLIAKGYIHQIYDPISYKASGIPATYYIAVNGVRYIRTLNRYPEGELRKRYPDATRSKAYIEHCLLMATYCANLQAGSDDTTAYHWLTPAQYSSIKKESETADFLQELQPHLFYERVVGDETVRYVVEHIYNHPQAYRIRNRLKKFINHDLYEGDELGPILLILCDDLADLIYAKRYARRLLRDDHREHPIVRVTTTEQLLRKGATAAIWEEVET